MEDVEVWLEKQKKQKPIEWSEEEREMLNMIEEAVDNYWSYDTGQRLTNFLESFHP